MTDNPGHQAHDLAVLEELCQRLLTTLPDCLAVALVDAIGSSVVQLPADYTGLDWIPPERIATRRSFSYHKTPRGSRYCCFEVPVVAAANDEICATLHIRFGDCEVSVYQNSIDYNDDVLTCIAQHMAIARELSSVQMQALQQNDHVAFLSDLDRAIAAKPAFGVMAELLEKCRQRLDGVIVAVLCPEINQIVAAPSFESQEPDTKTRWMRALGKLHTQSAKSRRVIVSEEVGLLSALCSDDGAGQMLVSVPIVARGTECPASLTIVGRQVMGRPEVQLLRAVTVKLSGLLMQRSSSRGQASRVDFIERIDNDIRKNPATSRCLLMIDIDRMHVINDRLGHRRGDQVISLVNEHVRKSAAAVGAQSFFSSDIGYVSLTGDQNDALRLATTIQSTVCNHVETPGVGLSLSVGVALIPTHAHNGSQALSIAELALSSAKSRGRNQCVVYENLDDSVVQRRSDLSEIGNLQAALLENRFVLYAQNIRSVTGTGNDARYEILTRMLGSNNELIPPNKFLSAAERYQMMPAVDRWVVGQTLRQLSDAENVLEINFSTYSINIAGQTLADPEFVDFLLAAIASSGLPPDSLCFEITESTAIRSFEQAQTFVRAVQKAGCSVALDDFGAGYCSFGYLESLPVDMIKLDGRFVRNLCGSPLNEVIVTAMVNIANVIGATTVAEFVQDDRTIDRLRELGVNYVQGYGISQPEPLQDVIGRMDSPLSLGLTGTVNTTEAVREAREALRST